MITVWIIAVNIVNSIIHLYFAAKMLNCKPKIWGAVLWVVGVAAHIYIRNLLFIIYGTDFNQINTWILIAGMSIHYCQVLLYKRAMFKKIIVITFLFMLSGLSSFLGEIAVQLFFDLEWRSYGYWGPATYSILPIIMVSLIFIVVFLLCGALLVGLWDKILIKGWVRYFSIFLLLRVFSLGTLLTFTYAYDLQYLGMISIAVSLGLDIGLLVYIISFEKTTEIENELQEIKRELELEAIRFKAIESQSEKMAKLRHDFNNQLAAITQLIRLQEQETAKEMFEDIDKEVNQEF